MSDAHRDDEERTVARLLGGVAPQLEMPEREKKRVLRALQARVEAGTADVAGVRRAPWWRIPLLAAAALLVAVVVGLLVPGGATTIAWADVARHLTEITTMSGPLRTTVVLPDGTVHVVTGTIYFRDPGWSRTERDEEVVTTADGATTRSVPTATTVIVQELPEDVLATELLPDRREAIRTRLDLTGTQLGPWRDLQLNPAAAAWSKLSALPADATRVLGRREIAGETSIGFAAPLAEVMGPQPPGLEPTGEVRVWASARTAVPLAVEIETRLDDGWSKTEVVEPIAWNPTLPASLFEDVVPDGWTVHERRAHTRGFPAPGLRPEVTLRIGPQSGGSVVNERDVLGAVTGTVLFESWKRQRYQTIVTFKLTDEAAARLQLFLDEHPDTPVGVDFNGEFLRPWHFRRVRSGIIEVDMSPLRAKLIDFEQRYLVGGEEAAAAEVERQRLLSSTPPDAG